MNDTERLNWLAYDMEHSPLFDAMDGHDVHERAAKVADEIALIENCEPDSPDIERRAYRQAFRDIIDQTMNAEGGGASAPKQDGDAKHKRLNDAQDSEPDGGQRTQATVPHPDRARVEEAMRQYRTASVFYERHGGGDGTDREFDAAHSELLALYDALLRDRGNCRAIVRNICDEWSEANGAVCDEKCDSYDHTDTCKATEIAEYLKSLRRRAEVAEADWQAAEREAAAKEQVAQQWDQQWNRLALALGLTDDDTDDNWHPERIVDRAITALQSTATLKAGAVEGVVTEATVDVREAPYLWDRYVRVPDDWPVGKMVTVLPRVRVTPIAEGGRR